MVSLLALRRSACGLQMSCAAGFMLLVLFCSNSVVAASHDHSAALRALGRIVYLPIVTLESDHNSDPMIFNADNLGELAKTEPSSYVGSNANWFEESSKFQASIAEDMGISGTYETVELSVSSAFSKVTGYETNVTVANVLAVSLSFKTSVEKGSKFNNFPLKSDFWSDFQSLPAVLEDPHKDLAWTPFQSFMNKWGSHIVTAAYTGAVFQSWTSAKSNYKYKQWEMEAKACVKAEGLKPVAALSICAGFNESERQEASKLQTTDTRRVKGGTKETRTTLAISLATPDLVGKFLNESDVDDQPVRYIYLPVWDYLLGRPDCTRYDTRRRALALQAYYEGWTANTCPLVVTEGQSNNNAQMFVAEYTEDRERTGYYKCIRRCNGCHNYRDDCWFDTAHQCCKSWGPSALKRTGDPKDFVIRAPDKNSGFCAWENGCEYIWGSFGCYCTKENEEDGCNYVYPLNEKNDYWLKYKVIWSQHSLPSQTAVHSETNSEANPIHLHTEL